MSVICFQFHVLCSHANFGVWVSLLSTTEPKDETREVYSETGPRYAVRSKKSAEVGALRTRVGVYVAMK